MSPNPRKELGLSNFAAPGTWKVIAVGGDIVVEKNFLVEQVMKDELWIEGTKLYVSNIGNVDLTNPKILQEQLIGVDAAYFITLIKKLKDSDKELHELDSNYLHELINEVFDNEPFEQEIDYED